MAIFKRLSMLLLACTLIAGCSSINSTSANKENKITKQKIKAAENKLSDKNITNEPMLTITLQTNAVVNPNNDNKSSPIVVIIYQLKNNVAFNMADFFSLYQDGKTLLGADYIDQQQIVMAPNQTQTLQIKFANDSQYLGVIAAFSNINGAAWRASLPIHANSQINISIKRSTVKVEGGK